MQHHDVVTPLKLDPAGETQVLPGSLAACQVPACRAGRCGGMLGGLPGCQGWPNLGSYNSAGSRLSCQPRSTRAAPSRAREKCAAACAGLQLRKPSRLETAAGQGAQNCSGRHPGPAAATSPCLHFNALPPSASDAHGVLCFPPISHVFEGENDNCSLICLPLEEFITGQTGGFFWHHLARDHHH